MWDYRQITKGSSTEWRIQHDDPTTCVSHYTYLHSLWNSLSFQAYFQQLQSMQIVPRQKIQHSFTDILKDPTPDNKHVHRGYQDYMDDTVHGEDNVSNLKQVSSLFFASSIFSGRKDQIMCRWQSKSNCCIQGVHGQVSN